MKETETIKNTIGAVREALEDFTEEEAMYILTRSSNGLPLKSLPGWNVDTVAHILSYLKTQDEHNNVSEVRPR